MDVVGHAGTRLPDSLQDMMRLFFSCMDDGASVDLRKGTTSCTSERAACMSVLCSFVLGFVLVMPERESKLIELGFRGKRRAVQSKTGPSKYSQEARFL